MDVLLRGNMKSGQKKIPYSPSFGTKNSCLSMCPFSVNGVTLLPVI